LSVKRHLAGGVKEQSPQESVSSSSNRREFCREARGKHTTVIVG